MKHILVALSVLVATAPLAQAIEPAQPVDRPTEAKTSPELGFVAALAGPALVTSKGGGTDFNLGGRVGFTVLKSPIAEGSLGLAVNTMTRSVTTSGVTVDGRGTLLMAEYVARRAFGTGLYFGGRLGLAILSDDVSSGGSSVSASSTSFAFAPVLGYEQRLGGKLNFMLDAAWENVTGGTMKFPTASVDYNSSAALALSAGISYGF